MSLIVGNSMNSARRFSRDLEYLAISFFKSNWSGRCNISISAGFDGNDIRRTEAIGGKSSVLSVVIDSQGWRSRNYLLSVKINSGDVAKGIGINSEHLRFSSFEGNRSDRADGSIVASGNGNDGVITRAFGSEHYIDAFFVANLERLAERNGDIVSCNGINVAEEISSKGESHARIVVSDGNGASGRNISIDARNRGNSNGAWANSLNGVIDSGIAYLNLSQNRCGQNAVDEDLCNVTSAISMNCIMFAFIENKNLVRSADSGNSSIGAGIESDCVFVAAALSNKSDRRQQGSIGTNSDRITNSLWSSTSRNIVDLAEFNSGEHESGAGGFTIQNNSCWVNISSIARNSIYSAGAEAVHIQSSVRSVVTNFNGYSEVNGFSIEPDVSDVTAVYRHDSIVFALINF